jgi:hypothetical protein
LSQIEQGDPQAAADLLPLVYEELRKLAAEKLAQENHDPPEPADRHFYNRGGAGLIGG